MSKKRRRAILHRDLKLDNVLFESRAINFDDVN